MSTKTTTIAPGKTHRDTAIAVYDYLRANPADWPNGNAVRDGAGHYRLTVNIEGTPGSLRFGELTDSWLDVFPDNVPWSEDALSRGAMFQKDQVTSDNPEDRDKVAHSIRAVLMRSVRYGAKAEARRAEHARRNDL